MTWNNQTVPEAKRTPGASRGLAVAALVAAAVLLGACSAFGDDQASDAGGPAPTLNPADGETTDIVDAEEAAPLARYESGALSFNDPADDGFAPIDEPDDTEPADVEAPDVAVEAPEDVLADLPTMETGGDRELLSTIDPIDGAPSPEDIPDTRDSQRRNELGELVTIDDSAGVACGNAEIAITALDEGRGQAAAEHINAAANLAAASTTSGMAAWAQALGVDGQPTDDPTVLVGFLRACSAGGYEL